MAIDNLEREQIESTISSPGWKVLKREFKERKELYKSLVMDANLDDKDGVNNAKSYQAMYHTTDAFLEGIQDLLKYPTKEEIEENEKEA